MRQCRRCQQAGAQNVYREDARDPLSRGFRQRQNGARAGIVDQNVQATPVFDRLCDGPRGIVRRGRVRDQRDDIRMDRGSLFEDGGPPGP
jgi:hypothetical protein